MSNWRLFWGVFAIIIGIILTLGQLGLPVGWGNSWPFLLLVPGLFFWGLYYAKKGQAGGVGILMPGTVTITTE